MIHMTLVHSNDDVVEEDFATLAEAHAEVVRIEDERHGNSGDERHGNSGDLRALFPSFEFTDAGIGYQQFGTNYHYVVFEEKS